MKHPSVPAALMVVTLVMAVLGGAGGAMVRSGVRAASALPVTFDEAKANGTAGSIDWGPNCDTTVGRVAVPLWYAPPCVKPFKGGNNGGATATGVTKNEIVVAVYRAQANPAVDMTFSMTGMSQFVPGNMGILLAFLKPPDERKPIAETCQEINGQIMATTPGIIPLLKPNPVLQLSTGATANQQGQFAYAISGIDSKQVFDTASKLEAKMHDYDGFVVIHGTDTMAHTAAALSFSLRGLGKPVVLTGTAWFV